MQIRQAKATVEDGRVYAGFADQAADGLVRWMLGPRFVDVIARGFVSPGHDQSFEYAAFAEDDKGVVGMVSGFSAEQHARSDDACPVQHCSTSASRQPEPPARHGSSSTWSRPTTARPGCTSAATWPTSGGRRRFRSTEAARSAGWRSRC
ncbi:MAG: hypothetical protein WCA29_08160 [Jiangellales bacterium]